MSGYFSWLLFRLADVQMPARDHLSDRFGVRLVLRAVGTAPGKADQALNDVFRRCVLAKPLVADDRDVRLAIVLDRDRSAGRCR